MQAASGRLDASARVHLRECERCRRLSTLLEETAVTPNVDPELLGRIRSLVVPSLNAVRPLPAAFFTWSLIALCVATALGGALRLGTYGFEKLSTGERIVIFSLWGVLIWMTAGLSVAEIIPGAKRRVSPQTLLLIGIAVLAAAFAVFFRNYTMQGFVPEGVTCLKIGLVFSIPAGLLVWLVLRRGFAIDALSAGLASGTLAGLAGLGVLELHCPNFKLPHVMVWHLAVVPLSAAAGESIAVLGERFRHN